MKPSEWWKIEDRIAGSCSTVVTVIAVLVVAGILIFDFLYWHWPHP